MKLAALLLALPLAAQDQVPPVPLPLPAPAMLPKLIVTVGGGFASPNGKFAYISESTLVLPQQTYATFAQEYSIDHNGTVQSCTFGGLTKPLYQLSVVTFGLTGLGGGCNSTKGDSAPAGSGQAFFHIRWGSLPLASVLTFTKNSNSAYKITLGFALSK